MNLIKTTMLLAAMSGLFMATGYLIGGWGGMLLALVIALATNAFAFWRSDKLALAQHNASLVSRASDPELYAITEALVRAADLPMPKLYIIAADQPNAFATGRNPENAAVAVTTGLMARLSPEELAGVIAHELAHIRNRDTLTMTMVATVAGAIGMLAQFGFYLGRGRDRGAGGVLGILLAVIVAPFAAMLIQMMVSRTREYAADRSGAEISRDPLSLASALAKIADTAHRVEMETAEAHPASAHLFIVNPLSGARMDNLFSTHPAVENRIAALQAMVGDLPAPRAATPGRASSIPSVTRRRGR